MRPIVVLTRRRSRSNPDFRRAARPERDINPQVARVRSVDADDFDFELRR